MKLQSYGLSEVGQVRPHNEDSFLDNQRLGLFVVADGMGGHQAGEVASRMATDVVSAEVYRRQKLLETYRHGPTTDLRRQILWMLEEAVQKASQKIHELGETEAGKQGMGTTLSLLLLIDKSAFIAHVGDSRIYLIRDGQLHHVTEDHTLVQDQIKKGLLTPEEIKAFPYKHVITRGVGLLQSVSVDTMHVEVAPADRFLLCSDGLYEYLPDEEIQSMFDQQSLQDITRRLVELANSRGGKDNITAVTVEVPDLPLSEGDIQVNRKLEALRQIPLFERLNYSELVKTLNIVQIEHRKKGDIIIREKEAGDRMYILVRGSADVIKDNILLTTLDRGKHFGEMALIDNSVRSATVRAAKDCDLLVIERNDFYNLLHQEAHLSVKILLSFVQVMSTRLRETSQAFSESRRRIAEINFSS